RAVRAGVDRVLGQQPYRHRISRAGTAPALEILFDAGGIRGAHTTRRDPAVALHSGRTSRAQHHHQPSGCERAVGPLRSLEKFAERVPDLFAERVLADGDAAVIAASARKEPAPEDDVQSALAARSGEIEDLARFPLRSIVYPRRSQHMVFLLAGAGEKPD